MVLVEEADLRLEEPVRRTYAARGQTSVVYCWERDDRLSVVAVLCLLAGRRGIGLYRAVHEKNTVAEELQGFLREMHRYLRRSLSLVTDHWGVQREAAKAFDGDDRLWTEWLLRYTADLNRLESVWDHTKYGNLANYAAAGLLGLEPQLGGAMQETRHSQQLLGSFFAATELGI